ncbi:MAG TPA: hypothetical protein PKK96_14750 [Anaerolineales bacterium]|nr:hypothetical protein [Anaerolineales bacterium]HNQ94574.1 hypothetical protein [Anaerolineales bacterium]HNS62259.1 hypothetical protein [Anaerolineales bacterium]
MLKEFKPNPAPKLSREEIGTIFQNADFHTAPKECRKAGYKISEFQNDIEIGAQKAIMSRRVGELLGFLYKNDMKIQYEIPVLLKKVFEAGDYHGFLKNVHRFKIHKGLEIEIDKSISHLLNKGQNADADGWRRKIEDLRKGNS